MQVGQTVTTDKGNTGVVTSVDSYNGKPYVTVQFPDWSLSFTLRKNGSYVFQPRHGKGLKEQLVG